MRIMIKNLNNYLFQNNDSDLFCVQFANFEPSSWFNMAGWQWMGRFSSRASGRVNAEAKTR